MTCAPCVGSEVQVLLQAAAGSDRAAEGIKAAARATVTRRTRRPVRTAPRQCHGPSPAERRVQNFQLKFAAMKKMPRNATASGRIGRKNSAAVPEDYSASDLARATVRADARPLLELPAAVGGEEQHSGAVVRAHEVAAPVRRHRRLALDVHVERATVHVL